MKYTILLLYPLLACLLTVILTKLLIPVLTRFNFIAQTGERHIHNKTTPTAGGIAMIIAFLTTMALFAFNRKINITDMSHLKLFLPLCILIPTGLIDDKFGLRARYKFIIQIIAALLCWSLGIKFSSVFGYDLPVVLEIALTVIWMVGFINAFNLIDGMDGLAAGITLIASICLGVEIFFRGDLTNMIVILCLGGVCLGFLKYNFYPARIFMGDTGSMFLGYMFAAVGIMSSTQGSSFSAIAIPILAGGVPLIDTILSVWRRVTFKMLTSDKNIGIMTADRSHIHHRLLDHNKNQRRTAIGIYLIALALGATGILASFYGERVPGMAFVLLLFAFVMVLRRLATIELWNSTQLLFQGFKYPHKGVLVCLMHPLWDLAVICLADYTTMRVFNIDIKSVLYFQMLYNIFPIMIFLTLARNYRVFWMRADIGEYVSLAEAIFMAFGAIFIINSYLPLNLELRIYVGMYMMFFLLTCSGILGERFMLRWLKVSMIKYYYNSKLNHTSIPVLLYGGGFNSAIYNTLTYSYIKSRPEKIIGIIDDDSSLRGWYVYGVKVYGGIDVLEKVFKKKKFKKIIITIAKIDRTKLTLLKSFCQKNSVELSHSNIQYDIDL